MSRVGALRRCSGTSSVPPAFASAMAEPKAALSEEERAKILENVVSVESGGRRPSGFTKSLFLNVAVVWSLFQLWIASPIPYSLGWGVINSTGQRAIHLAVAIFLVFMIYPRGRRSPRVLRRMSGVLDETSNPGQLLSAKGFYRLFTE